MFCLAGIPLLITVIASRPVYAEESTWKVGIAKATITPQEPMWMSGYGPRLAKKKIHDIWIKVLALEAADGHRAVVVTSDVCGFSKLSYETICVELKKRCNLERAEINLTCSHTHTGPALRECLHTCWPWNDTTARDLVEKYTIALEKKIVDTTAEAFAYASPATLWATKGTADFGVNRRNNPEAEVRELRRRGQLKGPVDHSIPILAVRSLAGGLRAVLFGYSCHCTTLSLSQWSGDYAGFAMLELEQKYPGAEAMFFQACGADQNPLPRRTMELCQEYGHMLATGVEATLDKPMKPVASKLATAFVFVPLDFEHNMSVDELERAARGQNPVETIMAQNYLQQVKEGKPLIKSHPYAIAVWKLGDDLLWISMGGEVPVDYSLKFKAKCGAGTWVNGFAHDLVCYIPSRRIQQEGGGQEPGHLWGYCLPAYQWAPDVEDRITAAVDRLVATLR
jgi:neutral ceramidase